MNCECIEKVNEKLATRNTKLAISFITSEIMKGGKRSLELASSLSVEVAKIDSKVRGKALSVCVTFCPFCGQKAQKEQS